MAEGELLTPRLPRESLDELRIGGDKNN